MLAESIAVVIVILSVLGSGSYLLRVAWRRGGAPRKGAAAIGKFRATDERDPEK
jgi:hypothetical protein